jgi:hypothetical protein
MHMSVFRHTRGRTFALAIVLGIFGCLALAARSYADAPAQGVNCQLDGAIDGSGSSLQANMHSAVFSANFLSSVCGAVAGSGGNPAGSMVNYNYSGALTGSGAGLAAADCRAGAFYGTDFPYYLASYSGSSGDINNFAPGTNGVDLNNASGKGVGSCSNYFSGITAPFYPTNGAAVAESGSPFNGATESQTWPNTTTTFGSQTGDAAAQAMTIPIGASAVSLVVNLTYGDCGFTPPAGKFSYSQIPALKLTDVQISQLMGGSILTWGDAALRSNGQNAVLAGCTQAVNRVVRFDDSGSTGAFKQFVNIYDAARSGAACAPGTPWSTYIPTDGSANTNWPTGASCSTLLKPTANGGGALLTLLAGAKTCVVSTGTCGTAGGVGYADLADVETKTVASGALAEDSITSEQNNNTGLYVSPLTAVTQSNCDLSGMTTPGTSDIQRVEGTSTDTWAVDNPGTVHSLIELNPGNLYPDCSLTYDIVYVGTNGSGTANGAAAANPVVDLNWDQRRTEYAYFTFVLSDTGQAGLGTQYYAPIPTTFVEQFQRGFQAGF